jgi:hypothetical protein
MRILILTILFAGTFYFFKQDKKVVETVKGDSIDSIKVKISAPNRIVRAPSQTESLPESESAVELGNDETGDHEGSDLKPELTSTEEHVEEVQWTDLEEGWSTELKEMLTRLEPAEGEMIHKTYMQEQESYQAELDSLMNEKQQKATPEGTMEVDQLIGQLDDKHQARLKEVLGAHYEAVRDGYDNYMEQSQPE